MGKIRLESNGNKMGVYCNEVLRGAIQHHEYNSIALVFLREMFKGRDIGSLKLSDEFLVHNLDYNNSNYITPTRDECITLLETIGDTLLKYCHYSRENQDINTIATLKNLVLTISTELERIGDEIE